MNMISITRAEHDELKRDAQFAKDVVAAIEVGKGDPFVILSLMQDALITLAAAATVAEARGDA